MMRVIDNRILICKTAFFYWLVLFATSLPSIAQNNSGSVYSIYGLGELKTPASAQSKAMGFSGIGVNSPYWINTINPAGNINKVGYVSYMMDVGFYVNSMKLETSTDQDRRGGGGLTNLSYWFRFNNKWTGLLGLSQYSKVGYDIIETKLNNDYQGYDVNHQGSGGLNKIHLSNSIALLKDLTLGIELSYIFGNITATETIYSNSTQDAYSSEELTTVSKANMNFGLNYTLKKSKYSVGFGVIYDDQTNLTSKQTTTLVDNDEAVILDEEVISQLDYTLPRKLGFGISYSTDKWLLATDVELNNWSSINLESVDGLQDTWRYSIGAEYTPDLFGESYLQKVSYRAGVYSENSYLTIDDNNFNNIGITTGVGLPIKAGGMLNLSYHRKVNGTVQNNLILETTNKFSLDITFRDSWFIKKKYN